MYATSAAIIKRPTMGPTIAPIIHVLNFLPPLVGTEVELPDDSAFVTLATE